MDSKPKQSPQDDGEYTGPEPIDVNDLVEDPLDLDLVVGEQPPAEGEEGS